MDLELKRGDIVVCALSGDFGKPRPAVIIQSDLFNQTHSSITICPITTHLVEAPLFRLIILPVSRNGLNKPSQIMIDKVATLLRTKIRKKIGMLTQEQLMDVNEAMNIWLGLG